jgi:hypothetical protein
MSDVPEEGEVEIGSDENVSPGDDSYQERTAREQEEGIARGAELADDDEPSSQTDETSE